MTRYASDVLYLRDVLPRLLTTRGWLARVPRLSRAIVRAGVAFSCFAATGAYADALPLTVNNGIAEQHYSASDLLARPDAATVHVDQDVYHNTVPYRAVPLLTLLGKQTDQRFDTVEAQASDGFVSQIPLALIAKGDTPNDTPNSAPGARAWVAVEDPAHPWPRLPHEPVSAGPYYLIWEHPERSGVTREQWPYKLVRLSLVESPDHRWPQLAVPAAMSGNAAVRRGHDVFLVQCAVCHRINGGGAGEVGPDLGTPMSATQYLTDRGLRAIVRNPKAVRTWPNQRMPGFSEAVIPDADLDALVQYLHALAPHSSAPNQ
jgi:mono/diheme cytochrome c family protein